MSDTSIIEPTVLYRIKGDTVAAATFPTELGEALVVFRCEADAEAFRLEQPALEDFGAVGVGDKEIEDLLAMHSLCAVVMSEAWTGSGRVDQSSADNFLRLLRESEPA